LGNREDDDSDEETGKARIVVGGESERCEMPQRGENTGKKVSYYPNLYFRSIRRNKAWLIVT
jgi:hypothetical protein